MSKNLKGAASHREQGRRAGMNGLKKRSCPHQDQTARANWLSGFYEGQWARDMVRHHEYVVYHADPGRLELLWG